MLRCIELEHVWYHSVFDSYRHGDPLGQEMLRNSFLWVRQENGWYRQATEWDIGPRIAASVGPMLWRIIWAYQDELRFFQVLQREIAHARILVQERRWGAFPSETEDSSTDKYWNRCRFVFSKSLEAQVRLTMRKAFQFDTEREMMLAAIALKRYQLRHGCRQTWRRSCQSSCRSFPMIGWMASRCAIG
jgi:hypothetical protein